MPEETDYTEELDYNALKNRIKAVLRRYFEFDDTDKRNTDWDPGYDADHALEEIREIVGGL